MVPLKRLRFERHLTLDALAKDAGLSAKGIRDIENGRVAPSDATLFKLADALDIPALDLAKALAGTDEPEPVKDAA